MRIILGTLALALACAGCTAQAPERSAGPPESRGADTSAHQAHDTYVGAINSNNLETLLGVLTDDVVFLSSGEPPMVGKAAVKPWVDAYFKAYKTHWDKPVDEFIVNGEWAYERYSWKSTDTPAGGGDALTDTGWGVVIYHHDSDGRWRVARDAWGPDHPAK